MISRLVASTMLAGAVALAFPASAEEKAFPATLKAHAILPANTIIAAPADAADYLKTSGKFSTADRKRVEALGIVMGKDGVRETGLALPFDGQPMQGFSGIKTMEDGTFWSLSDNGFGAKLNSTDAMLMIHNVRFDWDKGTLTPVKTVFLSDPDKKAPFPIVMEGAATRYLTGADFDVESIQPVADGFWLGEEFGPYILKFDLDGKLTDVIATEVDGKPVTSPDNPKLALPANPSKKTAVLQSEALWRLSRGWRCRRTVRSFMVFWKARFSSMARRNPTEQAARRPALRIIEFNVASTRSLDGPLLALSAGRGRRSHRRFQHAG
jgi:hypothetical protein